MTKLKKTIAWLLPVALTLLFIEGSLFFSQYINHPISHKLQTHLTYQWPLSSEGWAYRYLKGNPEDKDFSESQIYQFHPTRGWTNKSNLDVWINGYQWTTNAFGHRSLNRPNPIENKSRVLVLGDSQTAGDEVDDIFAWPTLLQSLMNEKEVINLGVGGYGLTQMAITLDEEFNTWKPDTIVIAVISDDLYRSGLSFRSAPMPLAILDDQQSLSHFEYAPPMNNAEIKAAYFSPSSYMLRKSRTFNLFTAIVDRTVTYPNNVQKTHEINLALLKHIKTKYADNGIKVVFAMMPYPAEAQNPPQALELQFASLCEKVQSDQFVCVNGRDHMHDLANYRQGGGHYYRKGNETTANMIYKLLI